MPDVQPAIRRFFETYAQLSNGADITAMLSQFADPFLSADPHGTHCVRLEHFAAVLPKRKLRFDQLGCKPGVLNHLEEIPLDARYVLAKTRWRFDLVPDESGAIKEVFADSTFLVDTGGAEFKIVMYMAHQDILQILREHGGVAN